MNVFFSDPIKDSFAEANKLPKLNHVLQPRTTGFNFILEQCKRTGIDTIYDITALYETRIPQDERAFFMGGMPRKGSERFALKLSF